MAFFFLWLLYFIFFGSLEDINRSNINIENTFISALLSAVLIAPLVEEFLYRGFLLKSKWLRWISVAVLLIFTVVQFNYLGSPHSSINH